MTQFANTPPPKVTPRGKVHHAPATIALAVELVVTGQARAVDVAAELHVSPATVTRWVEKARLTRPAHPSAAELVARHAPPPPAKPEAPPAPLEDTSVEGMIVELGALVGQHKDAARRAAAIGDAAAQQKALQAAGAAMVEIRKLRTSIEGGAGVVLSVTAEGLEAARAEIRRRVSEIEVGGPPTCHRCGAELRAAWAAETVTGDVTGDASKPPPGTRGAT